MLITIDNIYIFHYILESKRIEDAGGYVFQNTSVPQDFNFGT